MFSGLLGGRSGGKTKPDAAQEERLIPPPFALPMSIVATGMDAVDTAGWLGPKAEIIGRDMQTLRLELDTGESVRAEPGAMVYMHDQVVAGCDSSDCFNRCVSGSPCIMGTFTAAAAGAYVALTPIRPAKILPLDLGGRKFLAQDRSYFASVGDVRIGYDLDCNCLRCCCGGQGLVRQTLEGSGMAYIGAMGQHVTKTLAPGEKLLIDGDALVAWESTVDFQIRRTGNCCTSCCAGEGFFNTELTGPGLILLQSYSHGKFKKFAAEWATGLRLARNATIGGAPPTAETGEAPLLTAVAVPIDPAEVRRRGIPMAKAAGHVQAIVRD